MKGTITKIISLGLLLIGAAISGFTQTTESYFDSTQMKVEPPSYPNHRNGVSIKQSFVVHGDQKSYLVIDFSEPIHDLGLYDENGIKVSSVSEKSNIIELDKYKEYRLAKEMKQGHLVIMKRISTFPVEVKSQFGLPMKLYEALARNSVDDLDRNVLTFLSQTEELNHFEKLYILQQFYFDGDLGRLNGMEDEEGGDHEVEEVTDSMDFDWESGIGWLGDILERYVWKKPDKNCMCKATFPFASGNHQIYEEAHLGDINNIDSFNWFEHRYTFHKNFWPSSTGVHKVWWYEDWNVGAARKHNAGTYMKRVGSDKGARWMNPNPTAKSPSTTYIAYNMLCEDERGQRDDCMCENRILHVGASYKSLLSGGGGKLNCVLCGKGYAWEAHAEDWAILTKFSPKTEMGILDAGRHSVTAYDQVSPNSSWDQAWFDIALNLGVTAGKMVGGDKNAWTDSNAIVQTVQTLKKLATQQPVVGRSGQSAQSNSELIKGSLSGKTYMIELWPNDPTSIVIHSFSSHRFSGHTKYKANLSINSHCWLAGYIGYKETEECCTEEFFNWVVGVNNDQQRKDDLREVNEFIRANNVVNVPHYNSIYDFNFTGLNEFLSEDLRSTYQMKKCPNEYHGQDEFTDENNDESEKIPKGTEYFIVDLLTNMVVSNGVVQNDLSESNLRGEIVKLTSIASGWYTIKYKRNFEEKTIKVYKP